jgi:hypothetical protein
LQGINVRYFTLPILGSWVICLLGCGGDENRPMAMATTPEKAKQVIEEVMEAWKSGKTKEDLRSLSPPRYLQDDDFFTGKKITNYKFIGEPKVLGTGMNFVIELTLQDGKTKKLGYRVVTEPNIAVTREDGRP